MKNSVSLLNASCLGAAMVEVMVGSAIATILAAGMMTGIITLQRSFSASNHHAKSQIEQARLMNYVSRDLRRALKVQVDTYQGAKRITMEVPDYYQVDGSGKLVPKDPVIKNGGIEYGNAAAPVVVSYYKSGSSIYRSVQGGPTINGGTTVIASDVNDFVPDYTDQGKQVVGVSVSFVPRFQISPKETSSLRAGTTVYATTLLRNKRQ